jgi:hypothetical protein
MIYKLYCVLSETVEGFHQHLHRKRLAASRRTREKDLYRLVLPVVVHTVNGIQYKTPLLPVGTLHSSAVVLGLHHVLPFAHHRRHSFHHRNFNVVVVTIT